MATSWQRSGLFLQVWKEILVADTFHPKRCKKVFETIANPRYMVADWEFGIRDEDMQKAVDEARGKGAQVEEPDPHYPRSSFIRVF